MPRRAGRLLGAIALVAVGVGAASSASAQTAPRSAEAETEARVHFDRGLVLLGAHDPEGALVEFRRSYELNPRASALQNIAVALQELHRYPEAARVVEQLLHDTPDLPPARRAQYEQTLAQLRGLVAHVQLVGAPDGTQVRLDGENAGTAPLAQALEVGAGRHVLEVLDGGFPVAHEEFAIASGETRDLRVRLRATPGATAGAAVSAPPPPPPPPATLVIHTTPGRAVVVLDGRAIAADQPVPLTDTAGAHDVTVQAPGFAPWHGAVDVAAGQRRELSVRLADRSRLPPTLFFAGLSATVLLGAGAAVTGILTLTTRAAFDRVDPESHELDDLASRGVALRTATNVLLVATGVFGAATAALLVRTRFGAAASTADVAFGPLPGGGAATLRLRF